MNNTPVLRRADVSDLTKTRLSLRPVEAAKALGISPRLLWQLTHDGVIPCVRVGNGRRQTVLYPVADLQAWLSRQAGTDAQPNAERWPNKPSRHYPGCWSMTQRRKSWG